MERFENQRDDIFSKAVKAGKRTYFLDVKEMRSGEKYMIITESKKKYLDDSGKFIYEKHKIFLYKEDFGKFTRGLEQTINFINTGELPPPDPEEEYQRYNAGGDTTDEEFENL
ncbi:MAG: PUR family DNA/RNA-binding protein [Bacteroidales bacterium]|jgi:hypothetical protein|nr:PUR family DNA/RNA-binding protein [Bacteroidales bacterium]